MVTILSDRDNRVPQRVKGIIENRTHTHVQPAGYTVDVKTLEQAEACGWNHMVAQHPMGCVFHHTAFGQVLAATFPHMQPRYLTIMDQEGNLRGGLALFLVKSWLTGSRLVSLPFAFYGDPLVASGGESDLLFEYLPGLLAQNKASYVEIKARKGTPLLTNAGVLVPAYRHRTYYLDLSEGLDAVWSGFHRTGVKQKIRRAEKDGILVRAATCEQDAILVHALLTRTRRRLGLPPQKVDYFRNIWKYLVVRDMAAFLIAERAGQSVGGLCIFRFGDTMFLAYIGTDEGLHPEGVGQSLWWHAIQMAAREGQRIVDLGKTSPQSEGLITYKKRWGAIELETPVFYFPRCKGLGRLDNERKLSHRLIRLAWRIAPKSLSASLAQLAYRHMG